MEVINMPGFDGTGPMGKGPFTGRGRGFCVVPINNNTGNSSGVGGLQNYPVNFYYPNSQTYNNFFRPSYQYPLFQMRYYGYVGRAGGYFVRTVARPFLMSIGKKGK